MLVMLRQIAFYILKLEDLGVENHDIIRSVIEELAMIDSLGEHTDNQTMDIFSQHFLELVKLQEEYKKICKEKKIKCKEVRSSVKFTLEMTISTLIHHGEKVFLEKYNKMSPKHKELLEILTGVIRGVAVDIMTLKELDAIHKTACHDIVHALNLFNSARISLDKVQKQTVKLVHTNFELLKLINDTQIKLYGKPEKVEVSTSTRPGKAVLVSGSSLFDLHDILEAAKAKKVDVYTNGNLLTAHSFPKFREFPNLKGHFGSGAIPSVMDFATFPGAILLTKNEAQNIEYLYRGHLFTPDKFAPKGVAQIENDDFTPLIEAAEKTKGFSKGQTREPVIAGFDKDDPRMTEFAEKFNNGTYKHLFIVGFMSDLAAPSEYFETFYKEIPNDCFVISFSYPAPGKNALNINIGMDYAQIYSILDKLFAMISHKADDITFMLSRCDVRSLANIIGLKEKGINSIFLTNCSPRVINPAILKAFREIYNVRPTTTPKNDLELILKA
jgi:hydroxylamine reductase